MNELTNWLINNGLTIDLLTLLLFIPVIATLLNFSRYIVGAKTLGVYPTLALAFAFYLSGARYGIIITVIVTAITLLVHTLTKKFRMHYISRISINYILISILLIGFLVIMEKLPFINTDLEFKNVSAVSIILITTLSDFIIKTYIKKDLFTTSRSIIETLIIASIGWAIIRFDVIAMFMINNLWIILVLIVINIMIGQTKALRLTDLLRFNQLFKNDSRLSK